MRTNHWVIAALLVAIAGLGLTAYYVGPPASQHYLPAPMATATSPPDTNLVTDDLSVDSFGDVPQCKDEIAIQTVTAMLRTHTFVRIIGLSNVMSADQDQSTSQECQASVEIGRGKVSPVRYRISKSEHHDGWQITVRADAALIQLPPPRL